jgi:translation initiation factor 1A
MPPKKGKKGKSRKNNSVESTARPLIQKVDGQEEYAVVLKMLGDRRLRAYCFDGVERLCKIRGAMCGRKKTIVAPDDVILVSLRDFTEKCCDVIHKYNTDEVRKLKKMGELVDLSGKIVEKEDGDSGNDTDDTEVVFEEI